MSMIVNTGVRFEYAGSKGVFNWVQVKRYGYLETKKIKSMGDWCLENFGVDNQSNWFYSHTTSRFYFTNQNDMLMFILRWANES